MPSDVFKMVDEPVLELRNAIITQAVYDYRKAMKCLQQGIMVDVAKKVKIECEKFFNSEWYTFLLGDMGDMVLDRLKQEVEDERILNSINTRPYRNYL